MSRIYQKSYLNLDAYYIENDNLRLAVLPKLGAKMASLTYKPQRFEVFFQPGRGEYDLAEYGDDFSHYDTSGADDCFPSVVAGAYPFSEYAGTDCPDHGELWSSEWHVEESPDKEQSALICEAEGVHFPYDFKRIISLHGNTVRIDYEIWNSGEHPLHGLWAFHGLLRCDQDSRIILPGVETVVNVQDSIVLGTKGTVHPFPVNSNNYAMDRIMPPTANKTEKYYVNHDLATGSASVLLNKARLKYTLRFPTDHIPYLGIWINEGGYKGEYNCALEPSNGFADSLEIAKELHTLKPISRRHHFKWWLEIELIEVE